MPKLVKTGSDSWTLGTFIIERKRYQIPRETAFNVLHNGKRVSQYERLGDAVADIKEEMEQDKIQ